MESCVNKTQTLVPELAIGGLVRGGDCEKAHKMASVRGDRFVDDDLYAVGKCFYYQTAYDKSRQIMQQLVANPAVSPGVRTKALYALGKIAARSGQTTQAMRRYEDAFRQGPSDMDALCQYARLAVADDIRPQYWDSVIAYIRQSEPLGPLTLMCVADYARHSVTLPEATSIADISCRALLQIDGYEGRAWSCLRDNADHIGYEMRHVLDDEQERYWLSRLHDSPRDMKALMALAEFYYGRGRYTDAVNGFSAAAEMDADDSHQADILDRLARSYYLAGADDLAQAAWRRLKRIPGQEGRLVFSRAMVAMAHQLYGDAMTTLAEGGMSPGRFHDLASSARTAAFLSMPDYSRVGKESAKAFVQALDWSDAHLKIYPDDEIVPFSREYANWRAKEAEGRPLEMVTANTDRVVALGRRWSDSLAGVYLTYAALSYIHRGKGKAGAPALAAEATADFDTGEALLTEVFLRKETVITGSDILDTYNLMEAWLSLGWSKFYRGDFASAAKVFAVVLPEEAVRLDRSAFDDLCGDFRDKFPRGKILPKQAVEAARGLGTSLDRLARRYYADKAYARAVELADQGARIIENGLRLERASLDTAPTRFVFDFSREVIDGDPDLIAREKFRFVRASYLTYLRMFSPAVRTETMFNLAVARYWHAKILREWGMTVLEKRSEAVAMVDVARARFHEVLSSAPDHPESYRFLEYIALIKGEFQKGLALYRRTMELGTDHPIDAALKLLEAANQLINRSRGVGEPLEPDELAQVHDVMILRVELAVTRADLLLTPESLEVAIRAAGEVSDSESICDPSGRYREPLSEMVARINALLGPVGDKGRVQRARIHQKVFARLTACLSAHRLSTAHGVNLAPSLR